MTLAELAKFAEWYPDFEINFYVDTQAYAGAGFRRESYVVNSQPIVNREWATLEIPLTYIGDRKL